VGRERERELLLDAYERARQGRGQAVSIVSEAGMGKSRLLYEFRKAILNEDITFLEGKCLSFSRSVAYQPISDILKSNFDIRDGDWDSAVRNKVKQGLQYLAVEEGPATPYVLELLSVQDSGIEKIQISPEGKKDKITETIKKLILKGAEARPLVIAIEDLHWIDKTSEEVLKYLLESIAGVRVLLILTYRPEFIPTWGARSYHNQLLLNRLSNREIIFMASHILDTDDLETTLEEVILEKTEGIPFFVEEFIKSMKDLGFIERKDSVYRIAKELQTVRIPSTIQDIIMARVDALPEGAKELLQVGSLIEREFSYKLIKAAMHLPEEELLRRLSVLKDAELLYERGLFPDSTFVFKHALTREVVSETLLARKKKEIHGAIGLAMEEVYKDALEERYGSLAEHFKEGGDYEKATDYFHRATRKARRASAYREAIPFAGNEVSCAEKLPATADVQRRIIDARVTLANIHLMLNHYVEAKDAIAPIIDLARELDYRRRLPAIYVSMAGYLNYVEEKYNEEVSRQYLADAMKIALEEKEYQSFLQAYFLEGQRYLANCEYEKGEAVYLHMIELARAAGSVSGIVVGMFNRVSTMIDRPDEAVKCAQEALQLAVQADDLYLKGGAYTVYGCVLLQKGLFPEAEENLMLGLEMSQKTDFVGIVVSASLYLGILRFIMGRYHEAQECFNVILVPHDRTRTMSPSLVRLAQIWKVAAGVLGHLDTQIDEVRDFDINEIKMRNYQGMAAFGMGHIFLNIDDAHMEEAETWIKKAIEINERYKIHFHPAGNYALYAEFFRKKGDLGQARENLRTAIEISRSICADGWVKKYEEELTEL
jgi:tetratricopeptide (TPR) repeat protein